MVKLDKLSIDIVPILQDNYAYILRSGDQIAVLDPGEAAPVISALDGRLDYVLNTHHHGDHTAGNAELIKHYNAKLVAPAAESSRIKHADVQLSDGDIFEFGETRAHIIETPGHTSGGICYYFEDDKILFTGDTLFSLGCGRLFEGTPEQMFASLQKIKTLPDDTHIYPGHEYTQSNAVFCLHMEPDNAALQNRADQINDLRVQGKPTIPVSLGLEKETNVFLRAENASEFARLRQLKDRF